MTIQEVLDKYCLARAMGRREEQVGLANALVDEHIPELIERLGETMIERNQARDSIRHVDL
jgi:hypothetical protein